MGNLMSRNIPAPLPTKPATPPLPTHSTSPPPGPPPVSEPIPIPPRPRKETTVMDWGSPFPPRDVRERDRNV